MRGLLQELAQLESTGQPCVWVTVLATAGSTPQKAGAHMLVLKDGSVRGTIGGGAVEKQVVDDAVAFLHSEETTPRTFQAHLTHDLGMCCGGAMTVFLEKYGDGAPLVIFGAGHVSLELAALATRVGFQVTVVDERNEWLTEARFPNVKRCLAPPDMEARRLDSGVFACIATHDHQLDLQCLEALRLIPLAYLGVIGSRRKALRFRQRLEAQGFTSEECARFECPMGLEIGAVTPAEIAISTLGRLISVRSQRRTRRFEVTSPAP